MAQSPYVEMCISTIISEISAVEWDIIPTDGMEEESDESEIEHIRNFFSNPNTNHESFTDVFVKMPVRDVLEINSGVLNKVYNLKEELVEVVARDGSTFTKNPDIHGMFTNREEIIIPKQIVINPNEVINPFQQTSSFVAREQAAYFQYGWIAGPVPVPFGKKEIIWLEMMKRSDDHYGYSAVQILAKSLQTLIYAVENDLNYFNDNNVPKGIIGLGESDSDEIDAFKEQWNEQQRVKDEFGNWRKLIHKVPIVNRIPKFERIEFSSAELQIIEKQKWWSKMVWASFGVTPTELGYTEDAKGSANQIVQSKVFKKKAINPMIRLLEARYNSDIVSEFGYVGFITTTKGRKIEVPKYKFVFKVFDVDEEKNKYELYKLQLDTLKTINEVRKEEGLEPIEGGDEAPKGSNQGNNFNFGESPEKLNPGKPFNEREDDAVNPKEDKPPKNNNLSKEDKAQSTENPLILKEGEKPTGYKRIEKSIKYVLGESEKEIKKLLESEIRSDKIAEIKDLNSIVAKISQLFSVNSLKNIISSVVRNNYLDGWDKAEKEMDKNFVPEVRSIVYLSDYTFENIKGMEKDIANKLRQELQRGYMNGEGVDKLKERVKSVFDVGENRAEMIARTESNRASNVGQLQAYQKSGEKFNKVWITHFDDRTSPLCKRLDGQRVDINSLFKDPGGEWEGMSPPSHVNCRSAMEFEPVIEK